MSKTGIKELLDAGVHFGHQTRKWNPRMKPYIFEARNGIHIIDLIQTLSLIGVASKFLKGIVTGGGKVLLIGTKKQAQHTIKETAEATGQPYVSERWLGGMLTNLKTIKRSIKRLEELEKMETDGTMATYVKQEQSMLRREANRLHIRLDGIRHMDSQPDAAFIVDIKREHNAVAEARRLHIPIVAIVDTNTDPTLVDYPIPGNDDAIRSIKLIFSTVTQPLMEARAEYEQTAAKLKAEAEKKAAEQKSAAQPSLTENTQKPLPPEIVSTEPGEIIAVPSSEAVSS